MPTWTDSPTQLFLFFLPLSTHDIFINLKITHTLIIMDFIKKAVSSASGNKEDKPVDNNTQQNDDYVDKGEWFTVLCATRIFV